MKNKKKFSKIIRIWFITYIIMLVLPLLINFFLFRYSSVIIEEEISKTRSAGLMQLQSSIDEKLVSLRRTAVMLANDAKVLGLLKENRNNELESHRYEILELIKYKEILKVSNSDIDNILIYFNSNKRLMYDGAYLSDQYVYDYYVDKETYTSHDQWIDYMKQQYKSEYITQSLLKDNIAFAMSLPFNSNKIDNDNLFVSIESEKIVSNLKDYELSDKAVIYILANNNEVIASSNNFTPIKAFNYDVLSDNGDYVYSEYENKQMVAFSVKSNINDWKYVVLTDVTDFQAKKNNYTHMVILATLLNLILGTILAYKFSKRNYKPVKKIINMVSEKYQQTDENNGEEYTYLQSAFEKTFFKLDSLEDKVKEQKNILRKNFINRLLNGDLNDLKIIKDRIGQFDIKLEYDLFTVIIIQVNTLEREKSRHDLVPFVKIGEYFQEILKKCSNIFYSIRNNKIILVANSNKNTWNRMHTQIYDWVDQLKQELDKVILIQLNVAVSNCYKSLLDVPEAYQESLSCLDYIQKYESDSVMFYEEIQNNEPYYYPLSEEQILTNYIKNGDVDKAKDLLKVLYRKNFDVNNIGINVGKNLIFDITATVLKSMGKLNQKNIIDQDKELMKIIGAKSLLDMKKKLNVLMEKVCQLYTEYIKAEQSVLLSEKINAYIENNFMNSEINVSKLADYFQLTPSYLTKLYKGEKNISILKKINQVRINHAKELLLNTNLSINEIANKIGILYDTSFIRIFKSIEYITPGQYRRQNIENAKNMHK
ncbi:HTH-type transcriptional regulator YesS [Vallitalea longa]|uniref:HTH-type transcriptional regulator YesS n=1 Tax=Vallitalea longa TaxID=2936439 RepID=A0A9W6DHE1_9FIRM|nr:helix-turn-helix domain-containing protein [Vallitalea longa]GKX31472.1 HTH-type transcriptional regulator YesS [Vallitalea longa]